VSRYQKGKTNLDLLEQEIVSGMVSAGLTAAGELVHNAVPVRPPIGSMNHGQMPPDKMPQRLFCGLISTFETTSSISQDRISMDRLSMKIDNGVNEAASKEVTESRPAGDGQE